MCTATRWRCRNSQLALILDLEDLLATRGRVRDVELHKTTQTTTSTATSQRVRHCLAPAASNGALTPRPRPRPAPHARLPAKSRKTVHRPRRQLYTICASRRQCVLANSAVPTAIPVGSHDASLPSTEHTRMQRVLYALPQFCPGARDPMLTRSLQSARNCVRCRPPARFDPRAPPPSPPAARVRERVRESACAGSASRSRRVRAALAPKLRAAAAVRALCAIASPVAVPSALRREPGRGAHLHLDACLPAQALLEHEVKKTRGSSLPLTLRKPHSN